MNPKHTWLWVLVPGGLFVGIFLYQRFSPKPETGPFRLLPGLETNAVRSVEILPANQRPIRVELTNGSWRLVEPISFPARAAAIGELLATLAEIVPTTHVNAEEVGNIRDANEKFGFNPPPVTVILQPGD